ncbi:hypothetical protein E3N88_04764 [Mikania micrantha]|uniref:Uncharacterized protein n=1 Tax=Mikania micrantha TaxID=192012 RepID=A0A5N6PX70_9ASTR|nr:hypothetical protein E3N88_04764 [Mikania micrantha]
MDVSEITKDAHQLLAMLEEMVDEVAEENVVQVEKGASSSTPKVPPTKKTQSKRLHELIDEDDEEMEEESGVSEDEEEDVVFGIDVDDDEDKLLSRNWWHDQWLPGRSDSNSLLLLGLPNNNKDDSSLLYGFFLSGWQSPITKQQLLWSCGREQQQENTCCSAFEPPVDMSLDSDTCDHLDDSSCGHLHSEDLDPCCCESASISGRVHSKKSGEGGAGHEGKNENCCEPELGNFAVDSECQKDSHKSGFDSVACVKDQNYCDSLTVSNKDMSSAPESPDYLESMPHIHVPLVDVDKVRCVIRNIVRDWAAEGQKERDQCYRPILEELKRYFPERNKESPPTCLVPGAGLGRLALEISCLGFISQGNEFSYYMMICSSFILNQTQDVGEWTIHPWIHSNCNSLSDTDQLRAVSIPDIHPAGAGITNGFSMCGGDFVEVYNDPSQVGAWDAVVTCFFLDTAHNIVEYIEIISKILKDGARKDHRNNLYNKSSSYDAIKVTVCNACSTSVSVKLAFDASCELGDIDPRTPGELFCEGPGAYFCLGGIVGYEQWVHRPKGMVHVRPRVSAKMMDKVEFLSLKS